MSRQCHHQLKHGVQGAVARGERLSDPQGSGGTAHLALSNLGLLEVVGEIETAEQPEIKSSFAESASWEVSVIAPQGGRFVDQERYGLLGRPVIKYNHTA